MTEIDNGDYVRSYYRVPARRGVRVIVDGTPGRITGFDGQYLLVLFDLWGDPVYAHPTWRVTYLADATVTT